MKKVKITMLLGMFLLACSPLIAQPPPPGNPGDNNTVPIDGGASLLAAAGVAYGAKKLHDYRKQKKAEDLD